MFYGAVMCFLMFQMPLTKKTPVKRLRCPICGVGFSEEKDWTDHLVECGRRRMEKQSFVCVEDGCGYASAKKSDLSRHIKRRHMADDSDSTWEEQDPGDLSDFVGKTPKSKPSSVVPPSDLIQLGRVTRKPTDPNPVFAPRKKSKEDETQVKKTKVTSTITTPECTTSLVTSSAPILTKRCQTLTTISSKLCLVMHHLLVCLWSVASQAAPPAFPSAIMCSVTFRLCSVRLPVDASSQTDAPQRHHNRRRCTRTEHNGCVEEVVSEEEWWDYLESR